MSDTPEDQPTRPISVAELLARHGNIGSPPVTGRKRRRRGNADAVSVAELTGEIPVIRDTDEAPAEPGDTAEAPRRSLGTRRTPSPAKPKPRTVTRPTVTRPTMTRSTATTRPPRPARGD